VKKPPDAFKSAVRRNLTLDNLTLLQASARFAKGFCVAALRRDGAPIGGNIITKLTTVREWFDLSQGPLVAVTGY
jgi:hypothetical protein